MANAPKVEVFGRTAGSHDGGVPETFDRANHLDVKDGHLIVMHGQTEVIAIFAPGAWTRARVV